MQWLRKSWFYLAQSCGRRSTSSAVHRAAFRGDSREMMRHLRAGSGGVRTRNHYDHIPLITAAAGGSAECVALLLDAKSDVGARTVNGDTAAMRAAWGGNAEALATLLARGGNVDAANHEGRTALMCAAWQHRRKCVDVLVAAKCDVGAVCYKGHTALAWAARRCNDPQIIDRLCAGGAADLTSARGRRALTIAASSGNAAVVRRMLAGDGALSPGTLQDAITAARAHGHGTRMLSRVRADRIVPLMPGRYSALRGNMDLPPAAARAVAEWAA